MESNEIAQALRRSHCGHSESGTPGHKCAGVCKITPAGVELDCPLCGEDKVASHPASLKAKKRAAAIINAAGVRWDSLSIDAQNDVLDELLTEYCPYCGAGVRAGIDYANCKCGAFYNSTSWRGPKWTEKP